MSSDSVAMQLLKLMLGYMVPIALDNSNSRP